MFLKDLKSSQMFSNEFERSLSEYFGYWDKNASILGLRKILRFRLGKKLFSNDLK